jgi:hypothetical protein
MTDDETRRNRVFTSDDVQVSATNRGQRYANDGLTRASVRFRYLFDSDSVPASENIRFHFQDVLTAFTNAIESMYCRRKNRHQAIECIIASHNT